jgi:hypothetical protein
MILLIAGFHRSGTSMVANMFHKAGLFMGNDLLSAKPSNPYGHFEAVEIMRFHNQVLKRNGTSWQFDGVAKELAFEETERDWLKNWINERAGWANSGLKDPRLCLFLHEWVQICPEFFVVAIFRDFISTTRSLLNRHAADLLRYTGASTHLRFWQEPELPYRMWLSYNRQLLDIVRCNPERSLALHHAHVLGGLDVLGAVEAKIPVGLKPIDSQALVDLTITETGARYLPPIGPELREDLVNTWKEIETVAGASGLDIERVMQETFEGSKERPDRQPPEATAEYNQAYARYVVGRSRYERAMRPQR